MKISLSGLDKHKFIFSSDKFLRIVYNKKQDKYSVEVKENLGTREKISRFISDLFGTELRDISRVLNSTEGQKRLSQVKNKRVRANLEEINQEIKKLNRKTLVRKIPLINIPDFGEISSESMPEPIRPKSIRSTPAPPIRPKNISSTPTLPTPPKSIKSTPVPKQQVKKPHEYLISFYKGHRGTDIKNRTLDTMWNFTFEEKEKHHDYIQWLFPLADPSRHNLKAPVLTPALIAEMRASPEIIANLGTSLKVMLDFYGLQWNKDHSKIETSPSFNERAKVWLRKDDHNHLRLTRILKSLRILGLEEESAALFKCLAKIKKAYPEKISIDSFEFWMDTQI